MWRGIKLLSFWHRDHVRAARFQSSAAFRTSKTMASCCSTAVEVNCISAEPGCAVRSREVAKNCSTALVLSPFTPIQGNMHCPNLVPTQENSKARCFTIKHADLWYFHWNSSTHSNLGRATGNAMPKRPLPHRSICKNSKVLP